MNESELTLSLTGNTLDEIWDDLVRQVAISSQELRKRDDQTIDEQLKDQNEINRLNKLNKKTEYAAWKERETKKKVELYTKLQTYKRQLEEITHGKA